MRTDLERLVTEALKLTENDRATFAQLLLASLEQDDEIDASWAEEVHRRDSEIESGAKRAIPLADALARIRSR